MPDLLAPILDNPAVTAFAWALGAALVALWIAAAWWAYADALRRTDHPLAGYVAAGWIILSTPLLLPLSLAVYGFARPHAVAGDQRVRTLMRELGAVAEEARCSACAVQVDGQWLRCPSCAHWLATPCSDCGRWSDASLGLCPWCGSEDRDAPFVHDLEPARVPVAVGPMFAPPSLAPQYAAATALSTAPSGAGGTSRTRTTTSTEDPRAGARAMSGDDNDPLGEVDPAELRPGERAAVTDPRRFRLAWRAGGPTVPLAQRSENRRLAVTPDARRVGRSRVQRA